MSATTVNRMGRNPFGKTETSKRSPLMELRDEVLTEERGSTVTPSRNSKGLIAWATVALPARVYVAALKIWLSSL